MLEVILLLSGPIAVGKTTVRDQLMTGHGFNNIRSSDYLRALVLSQSGKTDRLELQELGDKLDLQTDYKWLLDDVAKPLLVGNPNVTRWLVDAVRKRRQIEHFREAFGKAVFHVHLHADEDALQKRYEARAYSLGDYTTGGYAAAIAHDNEKQSRALKQLADAVIRTDINTPEEVISKILSAIQSVESGAGSN